MTLKTVPSLISTTAPKSIDDSKYSLSDMTDDAGADVKNTVDPQRLRLSAHKRPGAGTTRLTLELHTNHAFSHLLGRMRNEKNPNTVPGLFSFANTLKPVLSACYQDDPWADWYLIRVEERLKTADDKIELVRNTYQQRIYELSHQGITFTRFTSKKPESAEIDFQSSYPLRAAILLTHFDNLMRDILPLRTAGIINDEEWRDTVYSTSQLIRRLFSTAISFKYRGVSREQLLKAPQSQPVLDALSVAGKVPNEIVLCQQLPLLSPRVNRYVENNNGQ